MNPRGAGFSGLVLGLVVAGWVKGEVSEEFAGLGCDDSDVEVGDQQGYGGVFVGSADADVVESAVVSECDGACFVDAVVSDSEVDVGTVVFRTGFGEPVVGGGWVVQSAQARRGEALITAAEIRQAVLDESLSGSRAYDAYRDSIRESCEPADS